MLRARFTLYIQVYTTVAAPFSADDCTLCMECCKGARLNKFKRHPFTVTILSRRSCFLFCKNYKKNLMPTLLPRGSADDYDFLHTLRGKCQNFKAVQGLTVVHTVGPEKQPGRITVLVTDHQFALSTSRAQNTYILVTCPPLDYILLCERWEEGEATGRLPRLAASRQLVVRHSAR